MKHPRKSFLPLLILLTIIFACKQPTTNESSSQTDQETVQVISIDTFSTFPTEIGGCSCYFSKDSSDFEKNAFIYMNDYDTISILKINGKLIKFIKTEEEQIDSSTRVIRATSDLYELKIKIIDKRQSGEETWLKTGTIEISNKNGLTKVFKTFYGECGC